LEFLIFSIWELYLYEIEKKSADKIVIKN